jgi:[acyl-carrier-protein] S-malonyltransferase
VSGRLFLFPGQGSQSVGMGRHLWEHHPAAAELFEEAGDLLGWDVRGLCLGGPAEELTRTDRAQPAIFVCSVATWRVLASGGASGSAAWSAEGVSPVIAMGHSLGEYSALVAAGCLGFAEALEVVERRGLAMWECARRRPGAMAAVLGLEDALVEEVCAEVHEAWPANYNCPGQLVISGSAAGVALAGELALARGARRVVPLPVSGAFHSPFMAEAAEALADALASVTFAPPSGVDFFSTTEVRVPDASELKDLLVRQMTSAVRFAQSLETVLPQVAAAFESGPGNVLSGLVKKVDRSVVVAGTADAATLEAALLQLAAGGERNP